MAQTLSGPPPGATAIGVEAALPVAAGAAAGATGLAAALAALAVASLSMPLWPVHAPLEVAELTVLPSLQTKLCSAAGAAGAGVAAAAGAGAGAAGLA